MRNTSRAYVRLVLGIVLIFAAFVLLRHVKDYSSLLRFVEKEQIDSGTLFYTESEEAGAVEFERHCKFE